MHMVGGDHVIKDTKPVTLLCFKKPIEPSPGISVVFEQERFLVATVSNVPEITRKKMSGGAMHSIQLGGHAWNHESR